MTQGDPTFFGKKKRESAAS